MATEAVRQAVRAGSQTVDAEHVVAALASIQEQVAQTGRAWTDGTAPLVEVLPTRRNAVLIPAVWPSAEQGLPLRVASQTSIPEILASLT